MDNDIAFEKITPCFENKKFVIFNNLTNSYGAGTTELFVLRSYYNLLNRLYVLYFLKSDHFISLGKNDFKSNSGHQRISSYFVENILFPLPPLEEQYRITQKLEEILSVCDRR